MSEVAIPILPPKPYYCPECKEESRTVTGCNWYKELSSICIQCEGCDSVFIVDGSSWEKGEIKEVE